METVERLVGERAVVIFSKSTCCMCHSIKALFSGFGTGAAVYELDELPEGRAIEGALRTLGRTPPVPAVFVGGEMVGGANEVIKKHLNRSLIPMLHKAGALWV